MPNPYDDINKSRVFVTDRSPLKDGDSVAVDVINTLECAVELYEFIDSFTIHISDGASWSDTTVIIYAGMQNPMTFYITFIVSGTHTLDITAYYTDGSTRLQTITLYTTQTGDMTGPLISIIYDSLNGDTAVTDTVPFMLHARIRDTESDLDTSTFRINGMRFDAIILDNQRDAHTYFTFVQSDFDQQPILVIISAEDIFSNSSSDTFWIRYQSISTFDSTVTIVRQIPSGDTTTSATDSITISGVIEDISSADSFYELRIYRNDSLQNIANYPSLLSNSWFFSCQLSQEWNTILLVIYPQEDDLLACPLDADTLVAHYQTAPVADTRPVIKK